jgi:hypothetical protein
MDTGAWLSFGSGIMGTVITIMVFWFTVISGLRKSIGSNTGRIGVLEERTKNCAECQKDYHELSLKMDIFWKAIEPALLKVIHSPNHPRRDYFSEIFLQNERLLNRDELLEYRGLLNQAIKENTDSGKIMAFSLVIARVDQELNVKLRGEHQNARVASINN